MPDYKVRLQDADGGDLIVIINAANKAAAEADAKAHPDAAPGAIAVDVELLDSDEASLRGTATQATLATIDADTSAMVTDVDTIATRVSGSVSNDNSNTTPLGAGANFTGVSVDCLHAASITIIVKSDQASAAGGLSIEWSGDGANWDVIETYSVSAGVGWGNTLAKRGRYLRVRYTNGATPQGFFRLTTTLNAEAGHLGTSQSPVRVDPVGTTAQPVTVSGAVDTEMPAAAALSDSTANPTAPMVGAAAMQFDGTDYERTRGVVEGTLFASSARVASADSPDITNYNGGYLIVVIDATAFAATPSVVFTIRGKDNLGIEYDILASVAVTGVSKKVLRVGPGLPATANLSENHPVPRTFYLHAEAADADSLTYSATYCLIP